MDNVKTRVAVLPWPEKENCFLCVSGGMRKKDRYGDKWYTNNHREHTTTFEPSMTTEPRITFAYRGERVACEWDGSYGPIQIWFKCEKDFKEEHQEARPHWLFDYAYGNGYWSQMAVDENNLYQAFNTGDYDTIFNVLKRFALSREEDLNEQRSTEV